MQTILFISGLSLFGFCLLVFFIKKSTKEEIELKNLQLTLQDEEKSKKKSAAIDVDTSTRRKLVSQWLRNSKM